MPSAASIDQDEIAQFSRHADEWWNPEGALRPLHKINPTRLEFIRDEVTQHFGLKAGTSDVFKGLSILDIGCGGGLLCEPMARLGGYVTGLDASEQAIITARRHCEHSRLKIDYHAGSAEDLAHTTKRKYDIVTALEILEHVADINSLLQSVSKLLKPGGIAIFSTVNRTVKSYLLGIVAAEYILNWVPRGTHDWRKFIRPSELAMHLGKAGLRVGSITGMTYDPLNDQFRLRPGAVTVNYLLTSTH